MTRRPSTAEILRHVENFQRRVIQDAVSEGSADYWIGRAAAFRGAKSRPGDLLGQSGLAAREARDRKNEAEALWCEYYAAVALWVDGRDEAGELAELAIQERVEGGAGRWSPW